VQQNILRSLIFEVLITVQWLIESNDQIKSASYLHEKWLKRTITWKYACITREAVDSLYGQKELKNLGCNSLISRTKQHAFLHGSLPTATIVTPLFACVRASIYILSVKHSCSYNSWFYYTFIIYWFHVSAIAIIIVISELKILYWSEDGNSRNM
jgi:hypothetical protein